jgi:hypothetical protein
MWHRVDMVSEERRLPPYLHGATTQKTAFFTVPHPRRLLSSTYAVIVVFPGQLETNTSDEPRFLEMVTLYCYLHGIYPSRRTMTLGSSKPLTEMSTKNLPGG